MIAFLFEVLISASCNDNVALEVLLLVNMAVVIKWSITALLMSKEIFLNASCLRYLMNTSL